MSLSLKEAAKLTLGPMLIGTLLSHLLTGIVIMQLAIYVTKYKKDFVVIRLLVLVCAMLTLAMMALNSCIIYKYAVQSFGDAEEIMTPTKAVDATLFLLVIPSTLIQLFFAWRVMKLWGRVWVLVVVSVLVAAQWGFCFGAAIIGILANNYVKGGPRLRPYLLSWWGIAMAVDLLIAVNLVWFFQTRQTRFLETKHLLSNLTKLTVRSGALVTIWAGATMFLNAFLPKGNMAMVFALSLPPMYMITLLSALNARYYCLQNEELRWADDSPGFTPSVPRRIPTAPAPSQIHVSRTVEAEAYQLEDHHINTAKTQPRAPRDIRHIVQVEMMYDHDHSIRDLDHKVVDVELGPDE